MNALFQDVSGDEAQQLLQNQDNLQVLDVRTPEEFLHLGHIPQALLRPVQTLQNWASSLDKGKPTLLICQHGVRSVYACQMLHDLGIETLYNLQGGMAQWQGELSFQPDETCVTL
jgi:rhodanese-related sulfurtransferase